MSIETELQEYIAKQILRDEESGLPDIAENLTASGKIDSLSLLQILGFIQTHFSVDLMSNGSPTDYESIQTMADAVRRLTARP